MKNNISIVLEPFTQVVTIGNQDDPANPANLENFPAPSPFTSGDITFELFSSLFLWLLIPGCGFFYSGLGRSRDALTMIMTSIWSIAIVTIQWWWIGYSLSFSRSANLFMGDLSNSFLIGVWEKPYDGENTQNIPELVYCLYQGITACIGPSLILGIIAARGRLLPAIIFVCIWTTFVYDMIACWSLNPRGWSFKMGVLDFGGGSPVHLPSAAAALAYTLVLGPRETKYRHEIPHNMINLVIGTVLIWFGSFGYNPGSTFAGNMVAINSGFNTNLSGSAAGIAWALMDYWRNKNWSAYGFCSGVVVGLVAITPGSGFVSPASSVLYGITAAILTNILLTFKSKLKFDDTLDVFIMHGTSGVVGNLLTGILAQKSYGGHTVGKGGLIEGHWMQLPYQIINSVAAFSWSFIISYGTLYLMNCTNCLRLRVTKEIELNDGLDNSEMGIRCYEFIHDIISNPIPTQRVPPGPGLIKLSTIHKLRRAEAIFEHEMESSNDKNVRISDDSKNGVATIPIGIKYNWFKG